VIDCTTLGQTALQGNAQVSDHSQEKEKLYERNNLYRRLHRRRDGRLISSGIEVTAMQNLVHTSEATSNAVGPASRSQIDWGAIAAGAVAAAAISVLLIGFGSAVGLSLTSARPFAGLSVMATGVLMALWLAAVHIGSFATGGYLASRMRARSSASQGERDFRDGAHGFLVWSIGTLLAAYLIAGGLGAIARGTAQTVAGAASTAATASALLPADPLAYSVDVLLRRQASTTGQASPAVRDETVTPEITRIFAMSVAADKLTDADRQYLSSLVATRTSLSQADAQKRVDDTWTSYRTLKAEATQKAIEIAETSRKSAVLMAFLLAAMSLTGLAAATWAAAVGSKHRDENQNVRVFGAARLW
jgi:hypothetical protein